MVSPLFDTTFGGHAISFNSPTGNTYPTSGVTNKTGGTNRVMVLAVAYDSGSSSTHITGISDNLGALTWSYVGKVQNSASGSGFFTIELWIAPASAVYNSGATNSVQSVTFSAAISQGQVFFGAVQGCNSISSPFDTNVSLPASGFDSTSSGTPPTVTFSTSQADDLLVAFTGMNNTFGWSTPAGWTNEAGHGQSGGDNACITCDYQSVSATQSNATYKNAGTNSNYWTSLVVAFTADTTPVVLDGGVGAYTITGRPVGNFLIGNVGSYTITGSTAQMASDEFKLSSGSYTITGNSALLYQQVIGTWASTEAKDTFFTPIPLKLDAYAVGGIGGNSSPYTTGTVTLSTNFDDEVIVVYVVTGGHFNSSAVTSISDTAGLTWKRRHKRREVGVDPYVEVWWAHAPTPLSADVITITTGNTGCQSVIAFGVVGANFTDPWDEHTLAPWYYDNVGSGNPTTNISTKAASSMMLALYASNNIGEAGTISSPFTYVTSTSQFEHNGETLYAGLAYHVASGAQSGVQVSYGQSGGTFNNRSIMTDAIVSAYDTGTADEVYWFLDPGSSNIVLSLSSSNQTVGVTGTTMYNHDLMYVAMVMIQSANGLGEVTAITDSGSHIESPGFARRSRETDSTGTLALEVWYGYSSNAFSSDTINVETTETAPGDVVSVIVFAVGGTTASFSASVPFWDGDTSLPATNYTDSGGSPSDYPHVANISTINQKTLLIAFQANLTVDEGSNVTLPFVQNPPPLLHTSSAGPAANLAIEFMYTPVIVSNELAEFNASPSPHSWVMIGDAIPVGPPVPPTGVWASTEAKDIFAAAGFLPVYGVLAAIEQADKMTGAPAQAPYDSIGWLGWVPATATWASVEAKDKFAATGWVLGFSGITGRWTSTEAKDRMAFSHVTSITGTWASAEAPDRLASTGFEIPTGTPGTPRNRKNILIIT